MAEFGDPERYCNARELDVLVRCGDYFHPEDEDQSPGPRTTPATKTSRRGPGEGKAAGVQWLGRSHWETALIYSNLMILNRMNWTSKVIRLRADALRGQ